MGLAILVPIGKIVFAAEETGSVKAVLTTGAGMGYLGAALAVGLACVGSGIAVSAGASAAIGASLSDALSGYWIWVPATFIIKAVTVLAFTSKKSRILCKRNFTALVPALVLCVGGYGLYSGLVIYGSLPAGFVDAPANLFQTAASAAVYIALSATLDKSGIKKRIH
jgi:uncharacterized membrane protein